MIGKMVKLGPGRFSVALNMHPNPTHTDQYELD